MTALWVLSAIGLRACIARLELTWSRDAVARQVHRIFSLNETHAPLWQGKYGDASVTNM